MRILLKNFLLLTFAGESPRILPQANLSIVEGRIARISTEPIRGDFDKVFDGEGKRLLLPGFVNAHTHLAMVLFRGYADDLPLDRWLWEAIWPAERHLTAEEVYWASLLGLAEMIRSGTTAFADMYFFMEEVARAVERSGLRALLAYGMIAPEQDEERIEAELGRTEEFIARWHGAAEGRIRVALGPHAPYTCAPALWERVIALARERGLIVHTHLAETASEVAEFKDKHGKTPVEYLEGLGLFTVPTLAAHCVHLSADDIRILAGYNANVNVVHNPTSNMKLGSGIAPVAAMLERGLNVALGTDGAASNNNLDMLEELRTAALLQKVRGDPTALPAAQALRLATVNGARALGLTEVGIIEEGKEADLVIVDLERSHLVPDYDLVSNLVYSANARDIETVIVRGKPILEDGRITTFDEAEARARVRELSMKYKNLRLGERE